MFRSGDGTRQLPYAELTFSDGHVEWYPPDVKRYIAEQGFVSVNRAPMPMPLVEIEAWRPKGRDV